MIYHDHQFQRQRYHERFTEMRGEYRRAQTSPRQETGSQGNLSFAQQIRSIGERLRRYSTRGAPAYRA